MKKMMTVLGLGALLLLPLVGCGAQPQAVSPSTDKAFETAWANCIAGHDPEGMLVKEGFQTPEQSCQRWIDTTDKQTFIDQWNTEYTTIARCVWISERAMNGEDLDGLEDELDKCLEKYTDN